MILHCNHCSFILAVNEKEVQSLTVHTAQKMKLFIKDFFRKCDKIRRKLQIWSDLLEKPLMENFILCAVTAAIKSVFWKLQG